MYRSQLYFEEAKKMFSDEDVPPIFVPSYNRPNPILLERLSKEPELKIVLCIRREQYDMYKHWEGKVYSIMLLDNVHEIGETRQRIIENIGDSFSHIFLFDDDVQELDYLIPSLTRGGKEAMRTSKLVNEYIPRYTDVLKLWLYYISLMNEPKTTISCPLYRPDSWHMKNKDAILSFNSGDCKQAVWLNVYNMRQYNINYKPNYIVGTEDYALQFDIMNAGLVSLVVTDLMYGCPAINSHPGGCENANGISDPNERYKWYFDHAKDYYGNHPGIRYTKSIRTKVDTVKFNWKYWRKIYESNNSK